MRNVVLQRIETTISCERFLQSAIPWTLTERALGQSASVASKSVSFASPCSAMSRSTR